MAQEIRANSFTIPANTPATALASLDMTFPPREVEAVEIVVPPGPNGVVGFYLANSGVQVIPINQGQFIISNDETLSWDLQGYINSGSWQVFGYNTGNSSHTIYFRWLLNLPANPNAAAVVGQALDLSTLGSSGGLSSDQFDGSGSGTITTVSGN
jgi:hypothetical protein